MSGRSELHRAYDACAAVTRTRAANFYYGIRLLPPDKRRALCAVYAFARRVDDIGDGAEATETKLSRLGAVRADVRRMMAPANGSRPDPVMAALADAAPRFALPLASFDDLIDGVESDVVGAAYPHVDDLVTYCRRVAGSIGRLSVAIFDAADRERAAALADDLGVAMQLTNVLRDVMEDRSLGRVYLPAEDLHRFGLPAAGPAKTSREAVELIRFEAARAREWFARGLPVLAMLDRRSASCVGAMAGIYGRVLARIEADPAAVFAGRVALRPWDKAWVAARSLAAPRGPAVSRRTWGTA